MKVLRLPREKVVLGMPLPWSVRNAQGLLLLSRGHIVSTEHQLNQILERGAFVDVEEIRAAALGAEAPPQDPRTIAPPNLFGLWNKTAEALRTLFTRPLENHTKPGEICYEPFSGTGPQIIAAEKLARRCFAMELHPQHVDVGVRRWQQFTGKRAVHATTGQPFPG